LYAYSAGVLRLNALQNLWVPHSCISSKSRPLRVLTYVPQKQDRLLQDMRGTAAGRGCLPRHVHVHPGDIFCWVQKLAWIYNVSLVSVCLQQNARRLNR